MSENSLTLTPKTYDKLGIVHCGVIREGFISCGGWPRKIEDGEELFFDKVSIKVRRSGSDYTFEKVSDTSQEQAA